MFALPRPLTFHIEQRIGDLAGQLFEQLKRSEGLTQPRTSDNAPESSSWSTMKRILLSTLLVVSLLLPIYPQLLVTTGCAHAQNAGQIRKASKDLIEKVNNGRGGDLVRVIIQPADAWDSPLDSTVQSSGGSDIRQFHNFRIRAATISANAALALSTRNA